MFHSSVRLALCKYFGIVGKLQQHLRRAPVREDAVCASHLEAAFLKKPQLQLGADAAQRPGRIVGAQVGIAA